MKLFRKKINKPYFEFLKNVKNINTGMISYKDKKILGENIRKLPAEYLKGVWEIVSKGM